MMATRLVYNHSKRCFLHCWSRFLCFLFFSYSPKARGGNKNRRYYKICGSAFYRYYNITALRRLINAAVPFRRAASHTMLLLCIYTDERVGASFVCVSKNNKCFIRANTHTHIQNHRVQGRVQPSVYRLGIRPHERYLPTHIYLHIQSSVPLSHGGGVRGSTYSIIYYVIAALNISNIFIINGCRLNTAAVMAWRQLSARLQWSPSLTNNGTDINISMEHTACLLKRAVIKYGRLNFVVPTYLHYTSVVTTRITCTTNTTPDEN